MASFEQSVERLDDGRVQICFQGRGLPVVAAEVASYGGEEQKAISKEEV